MQENKIGKQDAVCTEHGRKGCAHRFTYAMQENIQTETMEKRFDNAFMAVEAGTKTKVINGAIKEFIKQEIHTAVQQAKKEENTRLTAIYDNQLDVEREIAKKDTAMDMDSYLERLHDLLEKKYGKEAQIVLDIRTTLQMRYLPEEQKHRHKFDQWDSDIKHYYCKCHAVRKCDNKDCTCNKFKRKSKEEKTA